MALQAIFMYFLEKTQGLLMIQPAAEAYSYVQAKQEAALLSMVKSGLSYCVTLTVSSLSMHWSLQPLKALPHLPEAANVHMLYYSMHS